MPGFTEWLETPVGTVPRVSSRLNLADHLGAWKARWCINRMNYIVPAGLYAIGTPTEQSPVLVTANYKMSFDTVRRNLSGRSVWLLVLETYGINVWCAAGKGSFGTAELVKQVKSVRLADLVTHRKLILPILGAPGVSAHLVKSHSGFNVSYATIRACDLPEYLDNGMITTPAMQQLSFSLYERLVLVPVELVQAMKIQVMIAGFLFLVCWLVTSFVAGLDVFIIYLGAVICGTVLGPLLLPWLPGKSFAIKGAVAGLVWVYISYLFCGAAWPVSMTIAAFLALPAITAFHTLNFTGSTPFTSRSGVKKEMRKGLPVMAGAVGTGVVLLVVSLLYSV